MAQDKIDRFAIYAADYSDDFAREQFTRLNHILSVHLTESPNMRGYFYITGAPYRSYLFRVGRRTHFWIIYTVDEDTKTVSVLRFWNASKDPKAFEILSTFHKHLDHSEIWHAIATTIPPVAIVGDYINRPYNSLAIL